MLDNANYICGMEKLIEGVAKLSGMMAQMEEDAKEQFSLSSLTLTQMHYLEVINHLGNPSLTELAQSLRLTKPTVKVAVDKLIGKDYIVKVRSDADRRSAHIHLTEKGKLINQMHDFAHRRIAETIAKRINQDEIAQLVEILEKL